MKKVFPTRRLPVKSIPTKSPAERDKKLVLVKKKVQRRDLLTTLRGAGLVYNAEAFSFGVVLAEVAARNELCEAEQRQWDALLALFAALSTGLSVDDFRRLPVLHDLALSSVEASEEKDLLPSDFAIFADLHLSVSAKRVAIEREEAAAHHALVQVFLQDSMLVLQLAEAQHRAAHVTEALAAVNECMAMLQSGAARTIQRIFRGFLQRRVLPYRRQQVRVLRAIRQVEKLEAERASRQSEVSTAEDGSRSVIELEEYEDGIQFEYMKRALDILAQNGRLAVIDRKLVECFVDEAAARDSVAMQEFRAFNSLARHCRASFNFVQGQLLADEHRQMRAYYQQRERERNIREQERQTRLKRTAAAIRIQAWQRGQWGRALAANRRLALAETRRLQMIEAELEVERHRLAEEERHARMRAEYERKHLAAIKIQAIFRGFWARERSAVALHLFRWRIRIQMEAWENHRMGVIEHDIVHYNKSVAAATIQRFARRTFAKNRVVSRSLLSQASRSDLTEVSLEDERQMAAVLIQTRIRMVLAKRRAAMVKEVREFSILSKRNEELRRRGIEREEALERMTIVEMAAGVLGNHWTELATQKWNAILDAERAVVNKRVRAIQTAAIMVVQQFCRPKLSETAVDQANTRKIVRLAEEQRYEAVREVLNVVIRGEAIYRTVLVREEDNAFQDLRAFYIQATQSAQFVISRIVEARNRNVDIIQRHFRYAASRSIASYLLDLSEERRLISRAARVQRLSIQRDEEAQRARILSAFSALLTPVFRPIAVANPAKSLNQSYSEGMSAVMGQHVNVGKRPGGDPSTAWGPNGCMNNTSISEHAAPSPMSPALVQPFERTLSNKQMAMERERASLDRVMPFVEPAKPSAWTMNKWAHERVAVTPQADQLGVFAATGQRALPSL